MIFGTTPFAAAPFSSLPVPANNVYIGVEGIPLSLALGQAQASTAGNINVNVDVTGTQLTMSVGSLVSWIDISDTANNIWTEINT
jgi:hypothetical protein